MSIFNSDKFEAHDESRLPLIKTIKRFFHEEGSYLKTLDEPDMETIERYERTSFYNDTISRKLLESG